MPSETDYQISADQILASAVRFLIDGSEGDAANMLLSCSLHSWWYTSDFGVDYWRFLLKGPRAAYDVLIDKTHPIRISVEKAIEAVLPVDIAMDSLIPEQRRACHLHFLSEGKFSLNTNLFSRLNPL